MPATVLALLLMLFTSDTFGCGCSPVPPSWIEDRFDNAENVFVFTVRNVEFVVEQPGKDVGKGRQKATFDVKETMKGSTEEYVLLWSWVHFYSYGEHSYRDDSCSINGIYAGMSYLAFVNPAEKLTLRVCGEGSAIPLRPYMLDKIRLISARVT